MYNSKIIGWRLRVWKGLKIIYRMNRMESKVFEVQSANSRLVTQKTTIIRADKLKELVERII